MNETLRCGQISYDVTVQLAADGRARVVIAGAEHLLEQVSFEDGVVRFTLGGRSYALPVVAQPGHADVAGRGGVYRFLRVQDGAAEVEDASGNELTSQMPGKILAHLAKPGDAVAKGAPLLILEAMKMEHEICAPADGTVAGYPKQPGERVMPGDLLVDFSPA